MGYVAVLDANVLVPARRRDVLLTLAEVQLYVPVWSATIMDEMERHLPETMDTSTRHALRTAMSQAFPSAMVTPPKREILGEDCGVNQKDRHVYLTSLSACCLRHRCEPEDSGSRPR